MHKNIFCISSRYVTKKNNNNNSYFILHFFYIAHGTENYIAHFLIYYFCVNKIESFHSVSCLLSHLSPFLLCIIFLYNRAMISYSCEMNWKIGDYENYEYINIVKNQRISLCYKKVISFLLQKSICLVIKMLCALFSLKTCIY